MIVLTPEHIQTLNKNLGNEATTALLTLLKEIDDQSKAEMFKQLATKTDLSILRGELKEDMAKLRGGVREDIAKLEGKIGRLEVLIKVLIGLSIVGMGFFSPNMAKIIELLK